MTEIVGKIMVELLSTLALVTKQIRQGRPKKFVKKLFGENDVEAVLQRLDRLTQDEARTTAAQTLEVVYGLVRDMRVVLDDGKASADSVREALEIIQQIASDMNKSKRDKLHEDVRRWLSPPDPWKNHNLALGSRHTGTASWFVASSALSKWKLSGPRSLMWIHGKPGAGKSVFCSTIIDNIDTMTKSGLASLAFFYCDFREDEKRDLRGLLSSVLIQLCHQSDSYSRILSRFYSQHANGSKHPSDDELVRCLKDILGVPGQATVYLVIDGLDECSNTSAMPSPREKVLILLKDLIESRLPNLRICVTSRPEIDIQAALEPLTSHSISLHDERGQMEDIENYIKFVVNTDLNMRRWKTADKEQVIKVLIEKSDRMFRWVYCQIVYLRHCLPGRIRHALDELPETLDETYERALRDINKANWESAHRLLQCVAVAFRPLRVTELAEILSFDFKTGPIPKFDGDLRPEDPVEAVLSTTSSLLAIVDVEGSPVIQFSHYSVKEFLTSSRLAETNDIISRHYHVSMTPAHTLAAQACLSILLHLDTNVVSTDSLEKYPLAKYAAEYWVDHARFKGVSGNVEDGMKRLFDPSKKHLAIWVWIHDPILLRKPTRRTETLWWTRNVQAELGWQPRDSSLHYAAHCGLQVIVKFLIIQHSQDVDSRCFDSKLSPLHLASRQGHGDVALVLLEHGADLTAQTDDGSTPLHVASKEGCENAVRSLLEHGADVTARTNDGSTPLRETCNVDVARLLLEHGADATARSNDGSTPLHAASNVEVARSLLEHGADATARSNDGSTPLHGYSLHGNSNVEVARLLLEHGADATARSSNGSTSLHRTWDVEVARLLLKHGADATARSNDGSTPLHAASNVEVARLLLEHGADATARSNDGLTPLHGTRTILLNGPLPEHGTRRTARTKHGSILVHLPWNVEVARLLLEHGADATA
ncbi:ankyrin repeat-containing domain protein, partial [Russula ochroleuca]